MKENFKDWTETKQQYVEQALTNEALQSGRYDKMSDSDWCKFLESGGRFGRAKRNKYGMLSNETKLKLQNRSWLYQEYIVKDKNIGQLSKEIGASMSTISRYLIMHEINKNLMQAGSKTEINGFSVEKVQQMYWSKNLTMAEISRRVGVSFPKLRKFFKRNNIEIRDRRDAMKLHMKSRVGHSWSEYSYKKQGA